MSGGEPSEGKHHLDCAPALGARNARVGKHLRPRAGAAAGYFGRREIARAARSAAFDGLASAGCWIFALGLVRGAVGSRVNLNRSGHSGDKSHAVGHPIDIDAHRHALR